MVAGAKPAMIRSLPRRRNETGFEENTVSLPRNWSIVRGRGSEPSGAKPTTWADQYTHTIIKDYRVTIS